MSESVHPPGSWRAPAFSVLACWAAAAFGLLLLTHWLVARAGDYEPAGAAAGLLLLPLGLLAGALASRLPSSDGDRGIPPTAAGIGATMGAVAFAAAFGLSGPAGRPASDYPSAAAAEDALFASGQARSLGRVLVIGAGRPDLVRELLRRGAVEIDLVEQDPGVERRLAGRLSPEDREALSSRRVRRRTTDPLRFLAAHQAPPYDLAVLDLPAPTSIGASRLYSVEFHRALAARLAPFGVVAFAVRRDVEGSDLFLARIMATLDDVYRECAALPAGPHLPRVRFLAMSSAKAATLDPAEAARRASERTMPGGGPAPAASKEDFARLLDLDDAKRLSEDLLNMALDRDLVRETIKTPRLYLDYLRLPWAGAPVWRTGSVDTALRVPIWAYFAALWLILLGGGAAARRGSSAGPGGAPSRLALTAAAAFTGMAGLGGGFLVLMIYQSWTGLLLPHLPLLAAVFAAGWGLGAAGAVRLFPAIVSRPRRTLGCVGFTWLLVFLLLAALPGMPAESPSMTQMAALALAVLGLLGGMEMAALARLGLSPMRIGAAGGTGALVAAALAAGAFLPALGPAPGFLVMLGAKAVELGLVAAGAGRPPAGEPATA